MSDTTSFLGGAALAGLVALVMMRGGLTIGSPSMPSQQSFQLPQLSLGQGNMNPVTGQVMPPTQNSITAVPSRSPYEDAKLDVKVESLKTQIEQLQLQVHSQQTVMDAMTAQVRTGALAQQPSAAMVPQPTSPVNSPSEQAATSVLSGLPWALGGMMLTFGGGIALVGMFVLLARQNRSGRTIEFIHDDYQAYLPTAQPASRRRVRVMPPSRAIKRVEVEED
ncbi:MAG: hypothetical protein NT070_04880 [Cyanobacteria bacterium]|nr:hypothetical protein [Cyanobacteriota bacterium]